MRFSICAVAAVFAVSASFVSAQNPRPTPTETGNPTGTQDVTIAPSPTESFGCVLHIDHYHCEGLRDGFTASEPDQDHDHGHGEGEGGDVISDIGGEGCIQHGTHWHCPAGLSAPCNAVLQDYDLPLHIAALFVLLVASSIGVFLPVILGAKARMSSSIANVFFVFRHFGSGVIISTAFIHLLMHAFVMFANECLGHLGYEATAPAISMASLMVIFMIDFIGVRAMTKKFDQTSPSGTVVGHSPGKENDLGHGHDHDFSQMAAIATDGRDRRAHWEVQLLETGICFHSIMIGVTLGAQGGSGFIPTFCAIVFHQLFEGLGLGARIARLEYPHGGSYQKWLMCITYALITPVGIAIGMGVRKSFNLSGTSTILAIGVLDSISAGILLYTGIAQLLVGEWLAGDMRRASTGRVALGAFSLFLGLLAMSVIGKWA